MGRRAGLLSGGEQQMLAIAGALLLDPRILLLDEMSLGLAPNLAERLLQVVRSIADQRGIAVVLVEQNVHAALRVADRGYVLRHGELAASGSVDDLRADVVRLENSYLGNGSRAAEASSNGHG
jgi:branched-chain amino acid transport system ATP-binding protein